MLKTHKSKQVRIGINDNTERFEEENGSFYVDC